MDIVRRFHVKFWQVCVLGARDDDEGSFAGRERGTDQN